MTEREKLLQQVRMYHFALIEVGLFLDSHPKNAAALAYFQQNKQKYNDAVAAFESKFGPLTILRATADNEWHWVSDPWPWEGADN
ncbi:MAG: spore coat protein CotJB [Clostridiaceae bacterium]|nr:spore coat protein CotJB [Clostridiaceae bacterium]MDE7035796.1 spore coat protein CotJB [Eubacteriales bacterium]RKJ79997.1 spore coat protein CotJB [Butyricicoccus sp. 1XD8-22]MCI9483440.1 spore coat protein CotJB [Clostridiaceae bacterium]NBH77910.1 spore coat protein CotJB [Clostridiaceae bacterium]